MGRRGSRGKKVHAVQNAEEIVAGGNKGDGWRKGVSTACANWTCFPLEEKCLRVGKAFPERCLHRFHQVQ